MKLRQLQFTRAVAESGSFSRAADICHATQPTLSNGIAQLEEELGGSLFARTTRSVRLTPFGAYMLPHLAAVLDATQEATKAAEAFHDPRHKLLRIGFSPLVDVKRLDHALRPYKKRNPGISVFYKECLLDDISQRLMNAVIDVAIVPQNLLDQSFGHFAYYSDDLLYLPSADHPPASSCDSIRISELPEAPIIMTGGGCGLNGSLQALFDAQGIRLNAYPGQAVSYSAIEEWAELGIGAAILPRAKLSAAGHALPLHLVDGRQAVFSFNWIWNRTSNANHHVVDFIDYARGEIPIVAPQISDPGVSNPLPQTH